MQYIRQLFRRPLSLSNGMEFMRIPRGKFLMGSAEKNYLAMHDEFPRRKVDIPYDYWMARFPVTNEFYCAYVKTKGIEHPVNDWEKKKDHPVYGVEWNAAMSYCEWLNDLFKDELPSGLILRLPTEAEWEKAARGIFGNEWPWGNKFNKNKCNSTEGGERDRIFDTTPVGLYSARGDSPYGCADMAGNVWEWAYNLYSEPDIPMLRGGSCINDGRHARCAYRTEDVLFYSMFKCRGFRAVVSTSLPVFLSRSDS